MANLIPKNQRRRDILRIITDGKWETSLVPQLAEAYGVRVHVIERDFQHLVDSKNRRDALGVFAEERLKQITEEAHAAKKYHEATKAAEALAKCVGKIKTGGASVTNTQNVVNGASFADLAKAAKLARDQHKLNGKVHPRVQVEIGEPQEDHDDDAS
jgi:DNA-binding transcriptional regulator YhcF (GntR family)